MAEAVEQSTNASTVIVQSEDEDQELPAVKLVLRKPKSDKKVKWTNETVDNENMNKKKSKCCCIYEKPRKNNDDNSDEDDNDECDNCKGHVESRKMKNLEGQPQESSTSN